MKLIQTALRSVINDGVSHQFQRPQTVRTLSTNKTFGQFAGNNNQGTNSSETTDEFQSRIFGGIFGNDSKSDAFYQRLDRIEKARDRFGVGPNNSIPSRGANTSSVLDGLDESFDTLSDGMDGKLKKAATYFEFNPEEIMQDDYSFRPDVPFLPGSIYDTKDLDLKQPAVRKGGGRRPQFEVTTQEVLRKADFRNVRFLANFITEAGIIVKRSMTGISAKAQRKVAREIKTARAFGLMPFTTMGTKAFVHGKSMENLDKDFDLDGYGTPVIDMEETGSRRPETRNRRPS